MPTLETTFFFFRTPSELILHILIDANQPQYIIAPPVKNSVLLWFVQIRLPIGGLILCEKAKQFNEQMRQLHHRSQQVLSCYVWCFT